LGRIPNPLATAEAVTPARVRLPPHIPVAAVAIDDEVGRDSRLVGCGLAVLIVLAGIGVLCIAFATASSYDTAGQYVLVLLAVCVFGLAITVLFATSRVPAERTIGRILLWGFAAIGILGIINLMAAVAFFLVILITCSAMSK
jgi:hypothetical protein